MPASHTGRSIDVSSGSTRTDELSAAKRNRELALAALKEAERALAAATPDIPIAIALAGALLAGTPKKVADATAALCEAHRRFDAADAAVRTLEADTSDEWRELIATLHAAADRQRQARALVTDSQKRWGRASGQYDAALAQSSQAAIEVDHAWKAMHQFEHDQNIQTKEKTKVDASRLKTAATPPRIADAGPAAHHH